MIHTTQMSIEYTIESKTSNRMVIGGSFIPHEKDHFELAEFILESKTFFKTIYSLNNEPHYFGNRKWFISLAPGPKIENNHETY